MENRPKRPLFIFGYPRSGTTLLWSLLNVHSNIRLILEPELIRGMLFAGLTPGCSIARENRSEVLNKIRHIGPTRRHLDSLPRNLISEFLDNRRDLTFKQAYELLLPKPNNEAIVWGEKSLGNAFYISTLYELYPDAAFIHVVRDPRAALLSNYQKRFAGSNSSRPNLQGETIRFFARGAMLWKKWFATVEETCQRVKSIDVIQLRYRDFVSNPEKWLRLICNKTGLGFEQEMLDTKRRKMHSKIRPEFEFAHRNLTRPIDPDRANANRELPAWAAYIVEKYVADELRKLDLPSPDSQISFGEMLTIEAQMLLYRQRMNAQVRRQIAMRCRHTRHPQA
jgi:hypothetical protein